MSRDTITFGLLGRKLGHSWSPRIHTELGSTPYELVELEPNELAGFVKGGSWRGLNVTIPYKADVVPLADVVTPIVERLGAANTLVRLDDGTIMADNTDYAGFMLMLERFCSKEFGKTAAQVLDGRKVVCLGTGGASKAVAAVLEDTGAHVELISRTGDTTYDTLSGRNRDAVLLVNTTPVGMYPSCPNSPVDEATLAGMDQLIGVLDIIYNPVRTGLALSAEHLAIPTCCGLPMLVGQAKRSSELFQGAIDLDDALIDTICASIERDVRSIYLIGMPGCGKSGAGRRLAHMLGRPFLDADDVIRMKDGRDIPQIFAEDGEEGFRAIETSTLAEYSREPGIVVACGGGVVTRERNLDYMRQNGTIIMLDRNLDELDQDGRPLSKSKGVAKLAEERMDLYRSWADIILPCTGSAAGDAQRIVELLGLQPQS